MVTKTNRALSAPRRIKRSSAATATRAGAARPLTVTRAELLVNGSDREFRRLVNALFPFLALHTAVRNGYAELLGLTGPAYSVLLCIRTLNDNGPVNIRTIADQLRLSGSFITAETNSLERKGLVEKRRGVEDKRVVSVTLTARAIALLDSIAPLRQRVNDEQFGCLTRDEFRMLMPLVERLVQSGERAVALLQFLKQHTSTPWEDLNAVSRIDISARP
jgi:DNA-binding MarR family transcriptional regulator